MNQLMNEKRVQPPQQKKRWWATSVVSISLLCLTTLLTILVVAAGSFYAWAYFSTSSSYLQGCGTPGEGANTNPPEGKGENDGIPN